MVGLVSEVQDPTAAASASSSSSAPQQQLKKQRRRKKNKKKVSCGVKLLLLLGYNKQDKTDKQEELLLCWKKTWRKLKNKLSGCGGGCCSSSLTGQGVCSSFIAPSRRDKTPGASMLCCGRRKVRRKLFLFF